MRTLNFITIAICLSLIFSSPIIARTAIITATFGEAKNVEIKAVIVQSSHLFHMEQFHTDEDSLKMQLTQAGLETALKDRGPNNQFADLFIALRKDAAKTSGIGL